MSVKYEELTPIQKAAVALVALGKDVSADVLKRMTESEVEQLTVEIAPDKPVYRARDTARLTISTRDAGGRPEYHYVLLDYFCEPTGGELRAGDDVSRAQWVRRAELQGFHLTEGALPVIDAAFAMRGAEQ